MKKISNTLIIPPGSCERFLSFSNDGMPEAYSGGRICGGISSPLQPGYRVIYRKHAAHEWIYVTGGRILFRWNGKRISAGEGDFVFLPEQLSPHDFQVPDMESGMIWFHIRPERSEWEWRELPEEPFCRKALFAGEIKLLAELLHMQEHKNSSGRKETMGQIKNYLQWEVAGDRLTDEKLRIRIAELFETVKQDLKHPWKVPELARKVFLSESYFFAMTRRFFGESPQEMIRRFRVEHAVRLLHRTNLELKEIAVECGYANVYAFSKAFRKFTGRSPGYFRKSGSRQ
jgi:AraC-like DNA-binding protein